MVSTHSFHGDRINDNGDYMGMNTIRMQLRFYLLDYEGDFTVCDIMKQFKASRSTVLDCIYQLDGAGQIYHVQDQYTRTGKVKVYSTKYREFSHRTKGTPVLNKHCATEYILWLQGDFTSFDIVHTLSISESEFYAIKKELIDKELLFNVCTIEYNKRPTHGYNTTYREYDEGKLKLKGKSRRRKGTTVKSRKRVHTNPVDPLSLFIRPMA